MPQNQSVSEALQNLQAKGYHLADTLNEQPDESIQPNDWRLDSVMFLLVSLQYLFNFIILLGGLDTTWFG